eukprot:CAMPEP_0174731774 /NCGR_PEP_ID=MMETSP1094-20130205/58156_1 /TAXON_ID=156173 /ORGANISM="Chrysochromulina brevifilum, Strain UTEX LB 985" /LENGTH=51 /DNA_ID=CAMNT_0015934193 /DNA_START=8 /DNA_END=159 /DNA_ORIENTATION=+
MAWDYREVHPPHSLPPHAEKLNQPTGTAKSPGQQRDRDSNVRDSSTHTHHP